MKCLKSSKTGKIIRVSDKDAYNATSEWKLATRKTKSVQVIEQPTEEVAELSIEEKKLARKKTKK